MVADDLRSAARLDSSVRTPSAGTADHGTYEDVRRRTIVPGDRGQPIPPITTSSLLDGTARRHGPDVRRRRLSGDTPTRIGVS